MSDKKPQPIYESRKPIYCRVCGRASYSASGIHPQCAQEEANETEVKRLKPSAKPAKAKLDKSLALKSWHKRCPKCHAQVHIRKKTCACGHAFTRSA